MIIPVADRIQNVAEYYFSRKLKEVRALEESGKSIINLGIGSPDLPPADSVIEALQASSGASAKHGYQPYSGIKPLREAIQGFMEATFKVNIDPEKEILPLIGSKEGITHISMAFLNPGDKALIPNPGYPAYSAVTKMVGATPVSYSLNAADDWQPDWEKLNDMDLSGVKIMWLNYPHMPTGARAKDETFDKAIAFAKEKGILLVHDNPYPLVLNSSAPKSLMTFDGAKEVAIELHSMSKSHNMAGWRIGWAIADAAYIQSIIKIKSNVDSGMFYGIQQAAIEALQLPSSWHDERNEIYANRKDLATNILEELGCEVSPQQEGMFVWGRIHDDSLSPEQIVDDLLYEKSIFITPGLIFGSNGDRYLRVSLCTNKDKLAEALQRIKN